MINSFTNLLEMFNYANTDVHFSFYDYKLSKIQRKKIKAFLNYNKFSIYNIWFLKIKKQNKMFCFKIVCIFSKNQQISSNNTVKSYKCYY
jgi:hypothetical protein